jgi:two-component system, chemotaxis family, response regulator Rcp1
VKALASGVQRRSYKGVKVTEVESARPFRILLVEDSPSDVRLLKEAFKDASIVVKLTSVTDGVEGMAYLARMLSGMELRPDLIILDLNLPRKSGREVLAEIKTDERLRSLPILVMTSSNALDDVRSAYAYGADSFATKPSVLADYLPIVRAIENYWLLAEQLPSGMVSRFPQFEPYARLAS